MKKLYALLFAFIPLPSAYGDTIYTSILAGSEGGTYFRVSEDLQKLIYPDIDLEIVPTPGSLANIMFMGSESDYELAIVQSDVLHSQQSRNIGGHALKLVMPLYSEEVHVVAQKNFATIYELAGKKTSVGINGSGTYMTALSIENTLGINFEKVFLSGQRSLEMLLRGDIDAMIYVIGAPADLLSENIYQESNLHLLPLEGLNPDLYKATTMPVGTYAWQAEAINTVAVSALLITRDYEPDNPACDYVGRIAKKIVANLRQLRRDGHPKWRSVKFNLKTLKQYPNVSPCALKAFGEIPDLQEDEVSTVNVSEEIAKQNAATPETGTSPQAGKTTPATK